MSFWSLLGGGEYKPDENAANIPGAPALQGQLATGAAAAGQRLAPSMQAAQIDGAQQGEFRTQQSGLAQALQAQAAGQGPSLAQGQLHQATDRNLAQALALAQSQRGAGGAGFARNVATQQAAIGQQAAADSAQLRLQEQQQAQNSLGQLLAGARGQDLALAGQNAGFQQQASVQNQQAGLQQQALNDNLTQFYVAQGLSLAQARQQAAMQMEALKSNNFNNAQGRQGQLIGQLAGAGAGLAGTLASASGSPAAAIAAV